MKFKNILLILVSLIFLSQTALADTDWANYSLQYRIDNAIPNGQRPYQLQLKLHAGSGTNNATDVYFNSHSNANFSDVRYYLNNVTPLTYWMENSSYVWINDTANGSINIYYGNSSIITNQSNGYATFPVWDDFNINNSGYWLGDNGSILYSNGKIFGQTTFNIYHNISGFTNNNTGILIKTTLANTVGTFTVTQGVGVKQNGGSVISATGVGIGFRENTASTLWSGGVEAFNAGSYARDGTPQYYEARWNGTGWTYLYNNATVYTSGALGLYSKNNILISCPTGNGCTGANLASWDFIMARNWNQTELTFASSWSTEKNMTWSNNYTNDVSKSFSLLTQIPVNFIFSESEDTSYLWNVNGITQSSTANNMTYSFLINGTNYVNVSSSPSGSIMNWTVVSANYTLACLSPTNGTILNSPISLTCREWIQTPPYNFEVSTDSSFLNIVASGTGTSTNELIVLTETLSPDQYWWHIKNSTGIYTNTMNFSITSVSLRDGSMNITVRNESNTSQIVYNYTANFYGADGTFFAMNSNSTTGWANASKFNISAQRYLIVIQPTTGYMQRSYLTTSPGNLVAYVPSTNLTINTISYSILDITGLFPWSSGSTIISTYKGNLLMDSSNFGLDGYHPIYLIQGTNYQIQITNGNSIFYYSNYIPVSSGIQQITISNFVVNKTTIDPFEYSITYDTNDVTLNWNNTAGTLSQLNFTVHKGMPMQSYCQLLTTVDHGQAICAIDNTTSYHVIFSALMTDGTFQNSSFFIDYTNGVIKNQIWINPIDGSPAGIGFNIHYGTFTMPNWVYNWVSLILIVILAASFGGKQQIGAFITGCVAFGLEYVGWFVPISGSQVAVMGITGIFTFFALIYFLQGKERNQ